VVVETAGGLFSPLGDDAFTNADLVAALRPCAVLLVAPDRLGVLHDLTSTLGFASSRGLRAPGVALSAPDSPDASTGRNANELAKLGIATALAVFPRATTADPVSRQAAGAVIRWAQEAFVSPQ
jgi:dethiobiotin synthetase